MLLYNNQSLWRVILQVKGSSFFDLGMLTFSILIAASTALLSHLINEESEYAPELPHHYGILGVSGVVMLATTFRMNLAWARYWEAMTQQHFMYSKWADAFAQFCAFTHVTLNNINLKRENDEDSPELAAKTQKIWLTLHNLKKHFSLLSAVSADRLTHGDTRIMEKKATKETWGNQVMLRGDLRSAPEWEACLELPHFKPITELPRRSRVSISELAAETDEKDGWKQRFYVTEVPNEEEMGYLQKSTDRVGTVMYWILHDLASVSNDLAVAPPIQSRMFQELSNGMLGFSNSLKIADVPFPFPYAQLFNLLLLAFSFFIPVYVSVFTTSVVASPILAFCFAQGLWCFNAVAKEIENPFGNHVNGISLEDFHMRFINNMRDLEPAQELKTATMISALEQASNSIEVGQVGARMMLDPLTAHMPSGDVYEIHSFSGKNGSVGKADSSRIQGGPQHKTSGGGGLLHSRGGTRSISRESSAVSSTDKTISRGSSSEGKRRLRLMSSPRQPAANTGNLGAHSPPTLSSASSSPPMPWQPGQLACAQTSSGHKEDASLHQNSFSLPEPVCEELSAELKDMDFDMVVVKRRSTEDSEYAPVSKESSPTNRESIWKQQRQHPVAQSPYLAQVVHNYPPQPMPKEMEL